MSNHNNVTIQFIEGEYNDDDHFKIKLKEVTLNSTSYFDSYQVITNFITGLYEKTSYPSKIHIYLDLSPLMDPHNPRPGKLNVKFLSFDMNCRAEKLNEDSCTYMEFSTDLEMDMEGWKVGYFYFFLCTVLAVSKIISVNKILNICEVSPYMAKKISVTTLSIIGLIDLTIVWNFIYPEYCMPFQIWNVCQFWLGFVSSILPFWDLIFIIKINNLKDPPRDSESEEEHPSSSPATFIGGFYSFIKITLCFLIFVYATSLEYRKSNVILWFFAFFLVPQIWENVMKGNLIAFDRPWLIICFGNFVALILYFKGIEGNICHYRPSYSFSFFVILAVALQIWLINMQDKQGPRFFIPRRILRYLPQNQSSIVTLNDEEMSIQENDSDVCSICLNNYRSESPTSDKINGELRRILKKIEGRHKTILKTPCGHKFHVPCLLEWLSKKSQCPVCRGPIGEII